MEMTIFDLCQSITHYLKGVLYMNEIKSTYQTNLLIAKEIEEIKIQNKRLHEKKLITEYTLNQIKKKIKQNNIEIRNLKKSRKKRAY